MQISNKQALKDGALITGLHFDWKRQVCYHFFASWWKI